jgi:hypothetical protein
MKDSGNISSSLIDFFFISTDESHLRIAAKGDIGPFNYKFNSSANMEH